MAPVERNDQIRLDGTRWYDRLSVEFGQYEQQLEKVSEAYRSLDQLLSEPQPEVAYFTDLGQTRSLVHQIQATYAQLSTLPEVLNKYSAAMAFHTRKARKIVGDQIVTDLEITQQGDAYSKRLAEWSNEIESYCEGAMGLTSKVRKMCQLVQEIDYESSDPDSAKKTVKAIRKILYGGIIEKWNALSRFRKLFEKINYLSQAEFSFNNGISYYLFKKLKKME